MSEQNYLELAAKLVEHPGLVVILVSFALLVVFLFVALIVWIFLKGRISFNGKVLKVGSNIDLERDIMRQQSKWVLDYLESYERKLPEVKGTNPYRTKYILEKVYDEIVVWIVYNHISLDKSYVEIKQDQICYTITKLTRFNIYKSPEFQNEIREQVKLIIEKLVTIRETYR